MEPSATSAVGPARSASPSSASRPTPAGSPPPPPTRPFARRPAGVLLAVLAGLGLVLGLLGLASGGALARLLVLASALYLGYFFWARGVLKLQTKVLTGIEADRDNWRNND